MGDRESEGTHAGDQAARLDDSLATDDDEVDAVHNVADGRVEYDRARYAKRGQRSVRL